MSLELKATFKKSLPLVSGQGKNGTWQKQDFIIETPGQYPKNVCCTLWGDKVNMLSSLNDGQEITVHLDLESREYNGRWYTDVKVWKLEAGSSSEMPQHDDIPLPNESELPGLNDDDLPF
jgi:hypothetical protein